MSSIFTFAFARFRSMILKMSVVLQRFRAAMNTVFCSFKDKWGAMVQTATVKSDTLYFSERAWASVLLKKLVRQTSNPIPVLAK